MRRLLPLLFLIVAACDVAGPSVPPPSTSKEQAQITPADRARAERAVRNFVEVVETVEPVAENECRRRIPGKNCDFRIVVDDREGQAPNAFQTVDKFGRPVIAFNLGLIAIAQNKDELAFVMGHEAAHHIRNHLDRQRENATTGALIFAGLASLTGGDAAAVQEAQKVGALVGARTYSKDFELEADELGTVIAFRSGYDPIVGSRFFTRIPDPGNRFLGTHPPNSSRAALVRKTVAGLN